ncbi:ATP12 family protein [Devosia sp. 1566]|uniref:ATP12 family chaperone protein n=1 Tax=Devosia sp. 1566 TaxID=2499144 RepID=UPI000FD9A28F|nr:ATP12 family protein [Devosia sp. 1566]
MRDQLEDIQKHLDDGYGRAQELDKVELPLRFYKDVGVAPVDGGFVVTLDGRPTRTPGRKLPIVVPAAGIATTMAEEWAAQGERIDATTMPTVRLINSAIESGEELVPALRAEIIKFAGGDLMLYRAEAPRELVAEQEAVWDNALVALARHFGVRFQPTVGIVHQEQPAATLSRLAEELESENLLVLTALVSITGLTGSGLLALGLWHKLFTPDHVWTAAHLDEDFQIGQWGQDEEAAYRRARRRIEFDAAVGVLDHLRP